jgi:hypothetical protein
MGPFGPLHFQMPLSIASLEPANLYNACECLKMGPFRSPGPMCYYGPIPFLAAATDGFAGAH